MLDELTIYNLAIKYPNTVDLVREVERQTIDDAIAKIYELFERNRGKISLIDFDGFVSQMKGETK